MTAALVERDHARRSRSRTSWLTAAVVTLAFAWSLWLAAVAGAATPAEQADLRVDVVATGLSVVWDMRFLPDGDLLVTERSGGIKRVDPQTGQVQSLGQVAAAQGGEAGLFGLALDPAFPSQPFLYVAYSYFSGGAIRNRVSRLTYQGNSVGAEVVLVNDLPGNSIHDGGRLGFGPDGNLWITTGDAGDSGLAQDLASPAGKVLRITRSGGPAPGNPFGDTPPRSLIYSYGHRNAQGLAWRAGDGDPFITEHGPSANDEVNHLRAGGNFGWPLVGGFTSQPGFVNPVRAWTPTIAPAGAVFYERSEIPGWNGSFLFVTLKEQDLRRFTPANAAFTSASREDILFDGLYGRLRAIRVGSDGALYLGTSNRDGRGVVRPGDDRILRVSFVGRDFSDVPVTHPFFSAVQFLAARGIVDGYTDGRFGINDLVLRAQLAKMAALAFGLHTETVEHQADPTFPDVPWTGSAYPFDYVEEAAAAGLVQGYGNGLFGPRDRLTRIQLVRIVVRGAGSRLTEPPPDFVSGFRDVAPGDVAMVAKARFNGLIDGTSATTFNPYGTATRGHAAKVVYRALGSN